MRNSRRTEGDSRAIAFHGAIEAQETPADDLEVDVGAAVAEPPERQRLHARPFEELGARPRAVVLQDLDDFSSVIG